MNPIASVGAPCRQNGQLSRVAVIGVTSHADASRRRSESAGLDGEPGAQSLRSAGQAQPASQTYLPQTLSVWKARQGPDR
jgi:hypothetical protein